MPMTMAPWRKICSIAVIRPGVSSFFEQGLTLRRPIPAKRGNLAAHPARNWTGAECSGRVRGSIGGPHCSPRLVRGQVEILSRTVHHDVCRAVTTRTCHRHLATAFPADNKAARRPLAFALHHRYPTIRAPLQTHLSIVSAFVYLIPT